MKFLRKDKVKENSWQTNLYSKVNTKVSYHMSKGRWSEGGVQGKCTSENWVFRVP